MIEIEIIRDPDLKRLGTYRFYKNEITYGSDQYDELLSFTPNVFAKHLSFEVTENHLMLSPHENIESFHVNGKRTTAKKSLKKGDKVSVGETEFKILNFSLESEMTRKKHLNQRVQDLNKKNPEVIKLLQHLNN